MKRAAFLLCFLHACLASAQVSVPGALSRVHDAKPGEALTGQITIENAGDTDARVKLYLQDTTTTQQGPAYLAPGTLDRSNAKWIQLPSDAVVVPARGKLSVEYRVQVPEGPNTGTYWSALMIEGDDGSGGEASTAAMSVTVRQVIRTAMQLITNLPGGSAKLAFSEPAFGKNEKGSRFEVTVGNAGDLVSSATTKVSLFDAAGAEVKAAENRPRRLYPAASVRSAFELGALAPGRYQLLLTADDGNGNVTGVRYNVTVKD